MWKEYRWAIFMSDYHLMYLNISCLFTGNSRKNVRRQTSLCRRRCAVWFVSWDCNELAGLRKGGPGREDVVQASQWNVCPAKHTVHIMCCFSSCHIHMSLFWRKQEWQSSLWLSIHLLPVTTPPLEGHGGLDPSDTDLEAGNTPDMSLVNSPDTYRRRTIYSHIHLVTNYP